MAQINLLKQNTSTANLNFRNNIPKILIRVFLVIFIALIAYYGWLFFQSKSIDGKIIDAETKINADKEEALSVKNRDELLTRQSQIKNLQTLISAHVYWSQLFKPLADATLNNASYSNLKVGAKTDLTLTVTVPTLIDLDKYTQVFNLPQYNQNFSNVRIGGYTKVQDKTSNSIKFDVRMEYNPQLIQYKN